VRTIIPTADRQKATVKVRLTFDELDPRILPDMGVKVAFREVVDEEQSSSPPAQSLVPLHAVRNDGGQPVVFVIEDQIVDRRTVSVGRSIGTDIEIMAGVNPGDRVVVSDLEGLSDGQKVRVES
jgi:multidrug efflux pump subunit AcrA (membrane-fusion protein)